MDAKRGLLAAGTLVLIGLGVYALYAANLNMPEPQTGAVAVFDPLNASYVIDGASTVFVDGEAEGIRILEEPIRGDLNNDGREDAVLLLGHDDITYLAAALNIPNRGAVGTNAIPMTEVVSSLELKNNALVVNDNLYFYVWGTELQEIPVRNEFLEVDSPRPYEKIGNPVLVSGRSNFHEANTRIRIKDAAGNVLADTFTTAQGWMNALYPFSTEVSYEKPTILDGIVEIFEESAEDGSEIRKVTIPVVFNLPS